MSKSEIKQNIRSLIANRDNEIALLDQLQKQRDEAAVALCEIEVKTQKLGEPNYRDVTALDELESLRRQKQACQAAILKLEPRLALRNQINRSFVCDAIDILIAPLQEAQADLVACCAKAMEPYFATPERALEIAQHSDAARTSFRYLENFRALRSNLLMTQGEVTAAFFAQIDLMLGEAMKPKPDFNPFFRPYVNTMLRMR